MCSYDLEQLEHCALCHDSLNFPNNCLLHHHHMTSLHLHVILHTGISRFIEINVVFSIFIQFRLINWHVSVNRGNERHRGIIFRVFYSKSVWFQPSVNKYEGSLINTELMEESKDECDELYWCIQCQRWSVKSGIMRWILFLGYSSLSCRVRAD